MVLDVAAAAADANGVSDTTIAWIAVGGTALGAAIGSGFGGLLERLRDRADRKRRAKVGARLVRLDLAFAAHVLKNAETNAKWGGVDVLPMDNWTAYDEAIAAELDGKEFETVTYSVVRLQRLHETFQRLGSVASPLTEAKLDEEATDGLRTLRQEATAAFNALAKLAEQPEAKRMLSEPEPKQGHEAERVNKAADRAP